jgi:putative glutamine amidotransferase
VVPLEPLGHGNGLGVTDIQGELLPARAGGKLLPLVVQALSNLAQPVAHGADADARLDERLFHAGDDLAPLVWRQRSVEEAPPRPSQVLEHRAIRYIPDVMPRHPLVAVTATTRLDNGTLRVRLSVAYLTSLDGAGLTPIVVPPFAPCADRDAILDVVSGLVLTGGEDVEPARYGAEPHPRLSTVHADRDATELALLSGAHDRRLPVLAICRGIQVLNVGLGGTLIQDLPSQHPSAIDHDIGGARSARTHTISIVPDSKLASAVVRDGIAVNSFHHQAIERLADGMIVTATAEDGVIEGIETAPGNPWWALGIQWHPEDLTGDTEPWDRALFAAFATQVRETRPGGQS